MKKGLKKILIMWLTIIVIPSIIGVIAFESQSFHLRLAFIIFLVFWPIFMSVIGMDRLTDKFNL